MQTSGEECQPRLGSLIPQFSSSANPSRMLRRFGYSADRPKAGSLPFDMLIGALIVRVVLVDIPVHFNLTRDIDVVLQTPLKG